MLDSGYNVKSLLLEGDKGCSTDREGNAFGSLLY